MKPNSEAATNQTVGSQSYKVITQYGDMLVIKQGIQQHHRHHQHHGQAKDASSSSPQQQQQHSARPVIMTFHDIGLNSELQFARFCDCDEVKLMLQTFTMIHVNFVGQEFELAPPLASASGSPSTSSSQPQPQPAPNLPDDFKYPSVEQLAESIVDICTQLKVRSFIGLAVGAGAYVVSSLALMRPDLIDGLFLINPVITSCSITEWLYFKMSAIASSHHVSGSPSSSSSSSQHLQQQQQQNSSSAPASSSPKGGLRKLISAAAHLHLSHHSQQQDQRQDPSRDTPSPSPSEDARSAGQVSLQSASNQQPPNSSSSSGSRLRQLIFSRNLKNFNSNSSLRRAAPPSTSAPSPSQVGSLDSADGPPPPGTRADHSDASSLSGGVAAAAGAKRAPLEYLMYHHFGPASFQRYSARRSSDTSGSSQPEDAGSNNESGSRHSSPANDSPAAGDAASLGRANSASARQQSAGSCGGGGGGGRASRRQRRRSAGSVCLSAAHLASFASDRQKQAYIQSAYRHYFYQLNSHNLWLLAQSFVKRRALNLRKDCGAAAHAAAAAATLGTSICAAFVGLAPAAAAEPAQAAGAGPGGPAAAAEHEPPAGGSLNRPSQAQRHSAASTSASSAASASTAAMANSPKQQQQQALVAGTKVKRTFTCQTLIMCSAIPMHCERAFKLMSLLNPLQATWIKTDHLLVLEERPDKVCQALRLFLQGIGYSMSTYERRLRLSSTTGSAASADSSGSARSLSGDATASA